MQLANMEQILLERSDRAAVVEAGLLDLFAPLGTLSASASFLARKADGALWRSVAMHRANNLVQLARSVAAVAGHPSRHWLPENLVARARSLSRAYEELGAEPDYAKMVPCVPLLTEIAKGLTLVFGSARGIGITIDAQNVALFPDVRRALVLVCSEMLINALKHGYPHEDGGLIQVSLKQQGGSLTLVVEDDGVGLAGNDPSANDSGIMRQLAALLDATMAASNGGNGQGCRVTFEMDIDNLAAALA